MSARNCTLCPVAQSESVLVTPSTVDGPQVEIRRGDYDIFWGPIFGRRPSVS